MRNAILPLLLLFLLLPVAGCGPTAAQRLEGKWVGRIEIDEAKLRSAMVAKLGPEATEEVFPIRLNELKEESDLTMEFRADGTALVEWQIGGERQTITEGPLEVIDNGETAGIIVQNKTRGTSPFRNSIRFVGNDQFNIEMMEELTAKTGVKQITYTRQ